MTSTAGSTTQSARAVRRAAVVTHGQPGTIGPALARLGGVAREHGVEQISPSHGSRPRPSSPTAHSSSTMRPITELAATTSLTAT